MLCAASYCAECLVELNLYSKYGELHAVRYSVRKLASRKAQNHSDIAQRGGEVVFAARSHMHLPMPIPRYTDRFVCGDPSSTDSTLIAATLPSEDTTVARFWTPPGSRHRALPDCFFLWGGGGGGSHVHCTVTDRTGAESLYPFRSRLTIGIIARPKR